MKKVKITVFTAMTLFLIGFILIESPTLNPLYFEGAILYCFAVTAYIAVWALFKFGEFHLNTVNDAQYKLNYVSKKKFPLAVKIILAAPWVFLGVMMFFSSPIISWGAYRDQLGEVEVRTFNEDMQAVDVSQVPIVDKELAEKLADKKLGEKPSLGSQVKLGEPTLQMVNGNLMWVVPLEHSGFFKWLSNMSGTPGYITVSATNLKDVNYVDGYNIKYQPNCYIFDDLTRYVRFTSALFDGIVDYSFEIDDSGKPYWVVTTYKNERGFALPEATGVIIVDAATGESNKYTVENVPEWVDRVQPEDFVLNQIDNSGNYVHGIFNFSNKDKFRSSEGDIIVYNDGRCYLFTGLTSVGADESAIGFMMVDMVTKQPLMYQISGATETAAQKSAEGKVQNLRYRASFPLILNVGGEPTYFMTLKDAEGLIKQYALVSVSDYSVVGTGETIASAMNDYDRAMRNAGKSSNIGVSGEKSSLEGTVVRIASEWDGSTLTYKFLIEEEPQKLFTVTSSISQELALTQSGDKVKIEFNDFNSGICEVTSFDNLAFSQEGQSA